MKIGQSQIKQIIKEELQKVLQEGYGRSWNRGYDYYDRYQRGGSGYDEAPRNVSDSSYELRYGLDLPEDHRLYNFDFASEDGDWVSGRAMYLGDEFATKRWKPKAP